MNKSKTVKVKGKTVGGKRTLICVPLAAQDYYSLIMQAMELKKLNPDIIEWRVDYYDDCTDKETVLSLLNELRNILGDIPILYTLRTVEEGGMAKISNKLRREIIEESIESGFVDLVDVELSNDIEFIKDMRDLTLANGTKLILSYHNFKETPGEDEIIKKLVKGEEYDSDIVKLAVMPNSKDDVLTLMKAVNEAGKILNIPIIAISMGEEGQITRIACRSMGSAVTFAVGSNPSAPGQIGYNEIKRILYTLEGGRDD
jgi:3-dehydroquinate dehydratase-1